MAARRVRIRGLPATGRSGRALGSLENGYQSSCIYRTTILRSMTNYAQRRNAATSSAAQLQESEMKMHKEILEDIGRTLGVKELDDWYGITRQEVSRRENGPFLFESFPSLDAVLRAVYPEFDWQSNKFVKPLPRGYWSNPEHHKKLVESIGSKLGIKNLTNWYAISRKDVTQNGGRPLWAYYSSMEHLLTTIYPGYPWDFAGFPETGKARNGFWGHKENVQQALDRAERILGIKKPEDWYSVTLSDLKQVKFPSTVTKPKLAELLEEKYPSYTFEKVYLLKGRFAQQKRLERAVEALFPGHQILTNVRAEGDLMDPETGEYLELDVFLPALNLAFEYQEKHHYTSTDLAVKPLTVLKARDQRKKQLAESKGLTLVVVPCWWNGTIESIAATINKVRPELMKELGIDIAGTPIQDTPPANFFDSDKVEIDDIGEPMNACFFTLSSVSPEKWWMFEKYDGVRGFWNPVKKAFYSRKGNKFTMIPQEIVDSMPTDTFLDGEFWFGVNNFQAALKVAIKAQDIEWSKFKYMVFDIPKDQGLYHERYAELEKRFGGGDKGKYKFIELAPYEECTDMNHLERKFQDIIDKGGEGIILRDPLSPYQPGRSPGYLKHKKFRDAEARIIGSVSAHQWECELPNGIRFIAPAGTAEFARRWNPNPGDIVSFKHHGFLLVSKKPKFPALYRLRTDLIWEDVVQNWKEQKFSRTAPPLRRESNLLRKPRNYWRDPENRRNFFIEIAQKLGFDAYKQENWDNLSGRKFRLAAQGSPLKHFNGSIKSALQDAFPEFQLQYADRWGNIHLLRKFFDSFAEEQGFNPTDAEGWASVTLQKMLDRRGGPAICRRYGGWRKALTTAYPDIPFQWTRQTSSSS